MTSTKFKINSYLSVFKDKNLSEQLEPPFYLLGLILAVSSAPELIKPSEWYPLVTKDEDAELEFDNENQASQFMEGIMTWWNYVNHQFSQGKDIVLPSALKFLKSGKPSKPLVEFCEGYINGYDWLEDVWDDAIEDESTTSSLIGMAHILLIQIMQWPHALEKIEELPDVLGALLESPNPRRAIEFLTENLSSIGIDGHKLSRERLPVYSPETVIKSPEEKIGRNDPCPCGSGKKFKKCCLH